MSDLLGGIQETAFESAPPGGLLHTQFRKRRLRKRKETGSWLPGGPAVTLGEPCELQDPCGSELRYWKSDHKDPPGREKKGNTRVRDRAKRQR